MKRTFPWVVTSLLVLVAAAPAAAVIEGEIELRYWDAQLEIESESESEDLDFSGVGLRAEVVIIEKLAIALEGSGQEFSDDDGDFTLRRIQLDAKWRVLAPSENTYLGVGLGYTDYEFEENEGPIDSDAIRIVVDGSFGFIGILKVYGRAAYFPSLGDLVDNNGVTLATGDGGYDLDVGVGILPLPLLSIWVGYRDEQLDYDRTGGRFNVNNSGPYLGAGIRF